VQLKVGHLRDQKKVPTKHTLCRRGGVIKNRQKKSVYCLPKYRDNIISQKTNFPIRFKTKLYSIIFNHNHPHFSIIKLTIKY